MLAKRGANSRPVALLALIILSLFALCGGCSKPPPSAAPQGGAVSEAVAEGVRFVNVAAAAGLKYRWEAPARRPLTILDSIGNGCAFLDYNNDGNLDILLVGSKLALYQGDGKGRFTDATAEAGLASLTGRFLGCAVGDYDNDGYPDVYISGYQTTLLLHNLGGRRFEDVTGAAGLQPQSWGTSAAFADVDGDGKLDLYVGNYVHFDSSSQQLCKTNGIDSSCPPGIYDGVAGRLYRNLGGGRFADATREWGLQNSPGKTLGVAFADFDGSGKQSLALANDEVPGALYQNKGGAFANIGATAGIAYSSVGQPHAGMGQDWGDYDNDGKLDLTVMTFASELKPVYHNAGNRLFIDASSQLGLSNVTIPYVAFGVKWLDADNDGWLDIMMTNGHTADNIAETGQAYTYREPTLFLKNEAGSRFNRVSLPDLDKPIVGRGLAAGDYDNDGRIDALVVDSEGEVLLLHNETPPKGRWLTLRLIGTTGNRDGYGATVTLETATRKLTRHCHADGSYLSSSDPRVHFGLGAETVAKKITVRWSNGKTQTLENVTSNKIVVVKEGAH